MFHALEMHGCLFLVLFLADLVPGLKRQLDWGVCVKIHPQEFALLCLSLNSTHP